ncbi:MAG: hypothetical protein LUM44_06685 [Pyrinomonadaceae bacterium]|nr:hypothetical protein [Pyrinomonadaceae bacterium]
MNRNKVIWGIVALVVLVTIAVSFGSRQSYSQRNKVESPTTDDLSRYPVVDYDTPEIANATEREARRLKSKRYDGQQYFVKKNPHPETDGVIVYDAVKPPPAIPIAESNLIVIGEINTATAFLANDKGSVYTEFTIRVDEIFRADNTGKITKDSIITTDRAGGYVRYQNGQKVIYRFDGQDFPEVGGHYLLFLKTEKDSPNYVLVTAYELKDGKARSLDTVIPYNEFNGTSDNLMQIIKTKVTALTTNEN